MITFCEQPLIRKIIQLMLAALLATSTCLSVVHGTRGTASASDDLGSTGYVSYIGPMLQDTNNKNPSGTVALSNHMEITVGSTTLVAICAEHELDTPPLGAAVTKTGVVSNDDIRRILYYGYKGPEDKGYSVVRTATAVSHANGHMQTSLAQSMINAVRALPAPPSNWIVEMWNTTSAGDQNLVTGRLIPQTGWMEIQKKSADESMTLGNPCYSLENAVYGIFPTRDDATNGSNMIAELRTNALGYAKSETLETGTYYVAEVSAPTGMKLDETIYTVTVDVNSITRVNSENGGVVYDNPLHESPEILLRKNDAERLSAPGNPQGEATLAGSVWKAEFFFGYHSSAEEARASGKAIREWKFATDSQGLIRLKSSYLLEGSDDLWTADGKSVLPLGTIVFEEEAAPTGYLNTADIHANNAGESYPFARTILAGTEYSTPSAADDVIRGGVRIQKTDAETGASIALGAAELDGAALDIVSLNDQPVLVNGSLYEKGQTVQTLTIVDGWAQTSTDTLPYGTYEVRETAAGSGYAITEQPLSFSIRTEGSTVDLSGSNGMANQVKRGDVQLLKISDANSEVLANVAFRITSLTTGESHIMVTNEYGVASTATAHILHSTKTNGNDSANVSSYSPSGVWFGLTQGGTITVADDALGALPFDTYCLEEIPCDANDGLQLADPVTFTISQNETLIDLGEINNPKGRITTCAKDAVDGDKVIDADTLVTLVDTITYSNLIPQRTYTLEGQLVDRATGEALSQNGTSLTSSITFTPDSAHGSVEMPYAFNGYDMGEREVVPFVELSMEGRLLAEHKDVNDTEQIVTIAQPTISTMATAHDETSKLASCDPAATIIDTVSYEHLIPGKEYRLDGRLIDKTSGEAAMSDGEAVAAFATFTPTSSMGTARVEFQMNSLPYKGAELVVFETLSADGRTLVEHADINDEAQTVTILVPNITTLATDALDNDKIVPASPDATVRDTVTYENLTPGVTYSITGHLLYAETAEPVIYQGGEMVKTVTFTPEHASGSVQVEFPFDTTSFAGKQLLVIEYLKRMDVVVAEHTDPESEAQMVQIARPILDTKAADASDGDSLVLAKSGAVIRDTVIYEGLNPGMEYTLEGRLYDAAAQADLVVNGKPVTTSITFTPEESMGAIDMELSFNASGMEGATLVVFQTLSTGGAMVATHDDPADADQTIGVVLPADPGIFDKTGDEGWKALVIALALVVCGVIGAIAAGTKWGQRNPKRERKELLLARL